MSRSSALPADTRLGRTALRVADLAATIEFYRDIVGLRVLDRDETRATLGVDDAPLLEVLAASTAEPEPRDAQRAGLYHNAFRVPSRAGLGAALERIRDRWTLDGASDHGVSEALYCTDPAGNGVEIYRDRPREAWPRTDDGTIRAAGGPLDLDAVAAAADDADATDSRSAPGGTTLGHIHLEVSSLKDAETFYVDLVGFDVSMSFAPGARFVSAGGYHHHVGLNTWNRRSDAADAAGGLGLAWFEVLVPDADALETVRARLADGGAAITEIEDGIEVDDPDGIAIRVRFPGEH
ncbi:VOC family protein [Natrinema versiforme]|uniref:Glyoxalase/bleomycin resistance protein/dioxygenase n=1 Tax=Natrinema versiforme JCM 10478 TaxID=1227496 RepID=L9YA58_9EURY|nr:VOC family protein [Natrinema versiforme]ELY70940.1 Glyoxalase/bleomycin resistance protein/dioxygenase [Natrinema versiforme JCM 10478]